MLKKGSKLNSILTGTCPKCQNESMYEDKNPLNISKVLKMNENCSHCGLRYQIEPSFFYGAMYVSYALNVAFGIAAFIVSYIFFSTSIKTSFLVILGTLIFLFPWVLRWSRNIYINFFVSYNPNLKENKN
ncbi:DUF983 domain-containing protein [Flavobacterium sp. TSSA_36]|uniref:DUF983 domain-containing protein n=1 Tax=Flavobacterium sp. TSSA_36 TaxID=3447669 RepID=UPI003F4031D2